jgi:hypothetical protein
VGKGLYNEDVNVTMLPCFRFLMMRKGKGNCCMPLYSVASNPLNSNEFIVAGEDTKVHLFDKRFVFTKNAKPLKKFCPHTIVSTS